MKQNVLHAVNIFYVFGASLMGVLGIFALQAGQSSAVPTLVIAGVCMAIYLTLAYGSMKRKRWAYPMGLALYSVQVPLIATPFLNYSFYLGVKCFVSISLGAEGSGPYEFGLNLFALIGVVLFWINRSWFYPEAEDRFEKEGGKFPEQLGTK